MANLLFHPAELLREIEALYTISKKFISASSGYQIRELQDDIYGLLANGSGSIRMQIPENRPLKTRISKGEFEPAQKRESRGVYAEIRGVWEIDLTTFSVPDENRSAKKARKMQCIDFCGLASTSVKVIEEGSNEILASWKMDIADGNSPGSFFHTHATSLKEQCLPVPRHVKRHLLLPVGVN